MDQRLELVRPSGRAPRGEESKEGRNVAMFLFLPPTYPLRLVMVTREPLLFFTQHSARPWLLPAASSYPEGRDWRSANL